MALRLTDSRLLDAGAPPGCFGPRGDRVVGVRAAMEAFINDAASAAATDVDAAAAAHTALTRAALNPITGWGESVLQSAHRTRSSRDPSWSPMSRRDPARHRGPRWVAGLSLIHI